MLDGVCYINQLIFLMNADKIFLTDTLYEKAFRLFIERFKEWEFSWPFEADENYTSEGEEETKAVSCTGAHSFCSCTKRGQSLNHSVSRKYNQTLSIYA